MRPHHPRGSLLPHGFARQWPCAGPCATASALCRSSAWPCGHVPERALGGVFICAGTAHVPAAVAGQRFPVLRVAMALASRWRHVLAATCTLMSTAPVGRLSTQLLGLKSAMCGIVPIFLYTLATCVGVENTCGMPQAIISISWRISAFL